MADDRTELIWRAVAGFAKDFEQAALVATDPGRTHQLHERLLACVQTLNAADDLVRARWDTLLMKGTD